MKRTLFVILAGLLIAACCQSIWFTVEKGGPEMRPWLPLPKAAMPPITRATYITNRFDVLDRGAHDILYPLFADEIMRGENPVDVFSSALSQLAAMQGAKGTTQNAPALDFLQSESEPVEATVSCDDDTNNRGCKYLTVTAPFKVWKPLFVRVTTKTAKLVGVIRSCTTSLDKTTANDVSPCKSQEHGSRITLTDELSGARANDKVMVTFSTYEAERPFELTETVFTFIHLSDVQLRDPSVTLTDPELSHRLDWLIPSFEYDYDQAFYGRYVVEALFATINAEAARYEKGDPRRPAFVMHTGDSIDSGVASELVEFHGLVDELKIPFYNAIGNHDILVFGNLLPTSTRDSDGSCVDARTLAAHYLKYFRKKRLVLPNRLCVDEQIQCKNCSNGEATFVAKSEIKLSRSTFIEGFGHGPNLAVTQPMKPDEKDEWTCAAAPDVRVQPLSFKHGLDLNDRKGYYAFAQEIKIAKTPRHILFVVLDSEDLPAHTGGAGGHIGTDQVAWLKRVLSCAQPSDLVFVFSHHSMGDLLTDTPGMCPSPRTGKDEVPCNAVEDVLSHDKHVVGHFYGHNHKHGLCRDGRKTTCTRFWEIETGAMIEFPQEARLVRLKYAGNGLAYFDLTTFTERLEPEQNELMQAVARGRRGAERDYCHTHTEIKCSPDLHVQRQDGRHTNARLFFRLPETRE
jgi:3',5'-cyclic AMP phosphodiesterase CpdA